MLKIGHRGAKTHEPENTIRSFKKALELGVNAVELDVRKTKDGQLVVIHDSEVDKTTNGVGKVDEFTLEEIKEFVKQKGEKIPTLKEALDFLDEKVKILVELKETGYEEKVYDLIKEQGLIDNVIIVSFKEEALKRIRELDPNIETGFIYARYKKPLEKAEELKVDYVLPLYHFTHTADVKRAHEKGLKVIVWTINKKEDVEKFVAKGVDGITSDSPEILNMLQR
jgi:glycerophosphoryl diester phosphodiesterase